MNYIYLLRTTVVTWLITYEALTSRLDTSRHRVMSLYETFICDIHMTWLAHAGFNKVYFTHFDFAPQYQELLMNQVPTSNIHTCKRALYIRKRANAGFRTCISLISTLHHSTKSFWWIRSALCIHQRATHICKRALYIRKSALYIRKSALYVCKRAPLSTKERYTSTNEQHISAKEPYIYAKVPYMSAKEPHYLQKSAIHPPTSNIHTCKRALYIRKRANAGFSKVYFTHFDFAPQYQELLMNHVCTIYPLTSNTYLQKSPIYPQKCPVYPQKCPIYLQKSPIIYKRAL